jgi:type IV pilus assembly protein PilC
VKLLQTESAILGFAAYNAVEMEANRKKKLITVLVVVLFLPVLLVLAMVFLVPVFANLFFGLGVELPIPTRIVMGHPPYGWVYLAVLLLVLAATVARRWSARRPH